MTLLRTRRTRQGIRKHDLVAWKDETAYVIDGIICSDNAVLDDQYRAKVTYYQTDDVANDVMTRTGADRVIFGAAVINWRGAMAPKTKELLWEMGLRMRQLQLLTVRSLEGSVRVYQQWRRSGFTEWSELSDDVTQGTGNGPG